MRQRCEHGYVVDPNDLCPECERDALRAENTRLREALERIADISHEGGSKGMSEWEALVAIRKLSLRFWKDRAALAQKEESNG